MKGRGAPTRTKQETLRDPISNGKHRGQPKSIEFYIWMSGKEKYCADDLYSRGAHLVFLNGLILGTHRQPQRLLATLRQLRRTGHVGEFVSVQLHPTHPLRPTCT